VERGQHAARQQLADSSGTDATLGIQVYRLLRARFMRGEWLPGSKLTLRGLAQELGTSVQPVREAVGRLVDEKDLVLKPNHSVMVPAVERPALDDLWSMRILLEGEAARLCTPNLSDTDFAALDSATDNVRFHHGSGGVRHERVEAVQRVALIIARRSQSPLLAEHIENLRLRSAPYYAQAMHTPPAHDEQFLLFSFRLQAEMIDVMRARNADRARDICRADIFTYQRYVYRRLGLE